MHDDYSDIRNKIQESPRWFDEHAVPRYCVFSPHRTANVYATEAALVEIRCQDCRHPFLVCFSRSMMDDVDAISGGREVKTLADYIREKTLSYGDPPDIGCCGAGPTMTSEAVRVVQFWHRPRLDWLRVRALEIDLSDEVEAA